MNKETIEHAAEEYVMGNSASYVECFEAGLIETLKTILNCK